jgi:hypothetical protein
VQIYASDSFAYDFDAALADARRRAREHGEREKQEALSAHRRYWLTQFPETPSPEGLRRQIERFGPECVQEIADTYRVDLTATTKARVPKRLSSGKSKRAVERARSLTQEVLVGSA